MGVRKREIVRERERDKLRSWERHGKEIVSEKKER